ncbi:MAG: heme-binding protein [Bacteroidetes bacterium]|nr:heme-binding protein [Bacteroidota bacterium]
MKTFAKVSAAEAQQLISSAFQATLAMQANISVAVAGPDGELLAFLRMDGANGASVTISQNKAYTAARDRCTTESLGEKIRKNAYPIGNWGDPKITGFGGGLPIVQNGEVIGAIGVSGLEESEDIQVAQKAIDLVFGN